MESLISCFARFMFMVFSFSRHIKNCLQDSPPKTGCLARHLQKICLNPMINRKLNSGKFFTTIYFFYSAVSVCIRFRIRPAHILTTSSESFPSSKAFRIFSASAALPGMIISFHAVTHFHGILPSSGTVVFQSDMITP